MLLERTRTAMLLCPRPSSRVPSVKTEHDAKSCWFQAENKIKEEEKMKAEAKHILKTKQGSASSDKVYLGGVNANEGPQEYSRVSQPSNVSPGVSCESAMPCESAIMFLLVCRLNVAPRHLRPRCTSLIVPPLRLLPSFPPAVMLCSKCWISG
jgi:hypothetical protein